MNKWYGFSVALVTMAMIFAPPPRVAALTVGQLEKLASEITVFIPEKYSGSDGKTKEANGSGAIIAKQGNVYTVLTASHVVCRDPQGECKNYRDFKVVAPGGNSYQVNLSTVKKLPGVDLALFQFSSDRHYQLAALGNYPVRGEQFVFASGWPDPKFVGKRERFFNIGKVLPADITPFLKIYPPALGYDMVYTSVTYGGMSGGPVLDTEGRIIAVHGQNEGERIAGERVSIGFSLAIPITTFLQLAPPAGIPGGLNLENSAPAAPSPKEIGKKLLEGFEKIPDADSKNPLDWLNQGNKMWRLGQLALADAAYDRALQLDPDLYQAWFGKGLVLTYWKRRQEAIAAYDRALQINPSSETIKNLRDKLMGSSGLTASPPPQPPPAQGPVPPTPSPPDAPKPRLW